MSVHAPPAGAVNVWKDAGKRGRFATGPATRIHEMPYSTGEPDSLINDAEERGRFATGKARRKVPWDLLKGTKIDRPKNVHIKPEELRGKRSWEK